MLDDENKMVLALDCDGILADFVGASLDAVYENFGRRYLPEQVTLWDFRSLPDWASIEKDFWKLVKLPGFCDGIPVYPGAQKAVEELRKFARVEVVTKPLPGSPTWAHERTEWLERHFGFHHDDVHHVGKKERIAAAFLVEDNLPNLEGWLKCGGPVGFLWNRPYNEKLPEPNWSGNRLVRVSGWERIVDVVRAFATTKCLRGW